MSHVSFSLPLTIAISVACGKAGPGEEIQRETIALSLENWTDSTLAAWLAAGLSNVAGDKLAPASAKSGLSGQELVDFKRDMARAFIGGLVDGKTFPGKAPAENKGKKGKAPKLPPIFPLEHYAAQVREILSADELGMSEDEFSAHVAGKAQMIRAKRIAEIGRDPATYDAEEIAKAQAESEASTKADAGE